MKPQFITFTGVDSIGAESIVNMEALSSKYPIEWGVLASESRTGNDPRYPDKEALSFLLECRHMNFALHACGASARAILDNTDRPFFDDWIAGSSVKRVQINARNVTDEQYKNGVKWARDRGVTPIFQTRETTIPSASGSVYLFDTSGGRGTVPEFWPINPSNSGLVGYAGGMNPENVVGIVSFLETIGNNYWIDMETGVRTDDIFDFEKIALVCRAVYGH